MDPVITDILTSIGTSLAVRGVDGPFKTLDLFWQNAMFSVNHKLEIGLVEKQHAVQFKKEIADEINKIEYDNIQEPRKSIISSALDSSVNFLDEEPVRKMFAKLIASSMDSSKQGNIHPSFAEIVKQLSPNDAVLLTQLYESEYNACVRYTTPAKDNGEIDLSNYFVLPLVTDYLQTTNGIDNLLRLNLISLSTDQYLTRENAYEKFFDKTLMLKILKDDDKLVVKAGLDSLMGRYSTDSDYHILNEVNIKKGSISQTAFGKSFINICIR